MPRESAFADAYTEKEVRLGTISLSKLFLIGWVRGLDEGIGDLCENCTFCRALCIPPPL